jgi:membrane protein implicated in regulation of membrane protease activity
MFRTSIRILPFSFVLLIAAIIAFAVSAPTWIGALLLVAMLVNALVALAFGIRDSNRLKATARDARQRQAQERAPWQD